MACHRNHIKAVETLLSLGADPCITNKSGHTPVDYAADETFDYNMSTLPSLPQLSSLPTFDNRSPSYYRTNHLIAHLV